MFRGRRPTVAVVEIESGGGAVEIVDVTGEIGEGRIDLDENALTGARLGGVNDIVDVPRADVSEAPGATRIVQGSTALGHIGDPVLELHENVGTVVDADSIARTEVLIDPDAHDEAER